MLGFVHNWYIGSLMGDIEIERLRKLIIEELVLMKIHLALNSDRKDLFLVPLFLYYFIGPQEIRPKNLKEWS